MSRKTLRRWDAIEDDTSIVMNLKDKGLVILTGCAHSGIVNTVRYAREVTGIGKVHIVMGGFHLPLPSFEPIIDRTTQELQEYPSGLCYSNSLHWQKGYSWLWRKHLNDQFILNMAGTKLTFV